MLDILKFVFQNFWHWLGVIIILIVIGHCLQGLFTIKIKKHVTNDLYDDDEEVK